jgi:BolA family transcriptional regulator, general stress-responsive regulator
MSEQRIVLIKEKLALLQPLQLEITDDGHHHIGHAGAESGGHFSLLIKSDQFVGKNLVQRHRMVYDALGNLMQTQIHALSIRALAPNE